MRMQLWRTASLYLCAGTLALAPACANSDFTLVGAPLVVSISETNASLGSEQEPLFESKIPVLLPLRAPSSDEAAKLGALSPYPRAPFLTSTDTRVTVRFVLTNLDEEDRVVELLVDPWNEFVRYDPGQPSVQEEDIVVNLSGVDRFVKVSAKDRISGIITPDDFVELAKDLGTVQALAKLPPPAAGQDPNGFAGPALYNRAFNAQNRIGENDPVLSKFVPAVAAAVVGFDIGLRTRTKARVSLDLTYEITDLNGKRVLRPDEAEAALPKPSATLTPPPPLAQ
jgi:hypothetical protein